MSIQFPYLVQTLGEAVAWVSKYHGLNRGLALGVGRGEDVVRLLELRRDIHMTLVEDWRRNRRLDRDMERAAKSKLWPYARRHRQIRLPDFVALDEIEDGSLDFVFINKAEYPPSALDAVQRWQRKIQPRGMFIGGCADMRTVKDAEPMFGGFDLGPAGSWFTKAHPDRGVPIQGVSDVEIQAHQ